MKYYKVKTGYKADEFVSIDETELQKAIAAQITGAVAFLGGSSISGNSIMTITPDWNRVMGWNPDYHLMGEDYDEIGKEQVESYRSHFEEIKTTVYTELKSGGQKLID